MKRGLACLCLAGTVIAFYGCGGESEPTVSQDPMAQDSGLPDDGAPSGPTPCLNDGQCDAETEVCHVADGARVGECVPVAGARDGGMTDAGDGADAGTEADAQTCAPTRDAGALNREPEPEPPPPEVVPASSVVREVAIIAYWPLDGDFTDHLGTHNLVPNGEDGFGEAPYVRGPTNLSYGPTGQTEDNGARLVEAMEIDQAAGLSMEGWIRVRGNSTSGVIFGFGESGYQDPKLQVSLSWGYVTVSMGRVSERKSVRFERIGQTGCWHHIAVVFPPNFVSNPGQSFQLYIDGERAQPSDEEADTAMVGTEFFGGPFRLGEFTGDQSGHIQLDEVRIYDTVLLGREIRRLAESRGFGEACPGPDPPEWAPPERCSPTDGDVPVEVDLGLRVVSPNTVVLITDPNRWMKEKIQSDCGAYLRAMADAEVSDRKEYFYAAMETFEHYRPLIARSIYKEGHFRVGRLSGGQCEEVVASTQSCWPQGIREFYVPHAVAEERAVWTHRGEIVYFTYLTLDEPLVDGEDYVFVDRWGHRAQLSYTTNEEVSWAIKVNQVGYPTEGPKFGFAGFWLPGVGPLDLSAFDGAPFEVRRTDDHGVVHMGTVAHRGFTQIPNEDPDAVPVDHDQVSSGLSPWFEVARLVEYVISGQQALPGDDAELPRLYQYHRVEQRATARDLGFLVAQQTTDEDRQAWRNRGRQLLQLGVVCTEEFGPQEQVFGRVSTDRQLWKHRELGAGSGRLLGVIDDPLHVAGKVTDGRVDLAKSNLHEFPVIGRILRALGPAA